MPEEFSLSLGKSFIRNIAEKLIRKGVSKSLNITPDLELQEFNAWSEGDKLTVTLTTRATLSKEDILKLIKM